MAVRQIWQPVSVFTAVNVVHVRLLNLTWISVASPRRTQKAFVRLFLAVVEDIEQEQLAMTNYEQE